MICSRRRQKLDSKIRTVADAVRHQQEQQEDMHARTSPALLDNVTFWRIGAEACDRAAIVWMFVWIMRLPGHLDGHAGRTVLVRDSLFGI